MQEGERVMDTFQKQLHLPVTRIDDSKRMLGLLKVREPYILSCIRVYVCVCEQCCVPSDLIVLQ